MNRLIARYLMASIFFSFLFFSSSCSKKNTSFDYNEVIETVGDYVESQQMTDLLLNTYFKSISDSILLTDGFAEIDGADVSLTLNPAKIIIKYPVWGKDDGYGHYRKGIYEASTETSFFDSLATINFTFSNFSYDFDSVSVGDLTIINNGISEGNYSFEVNATNIYRGFHDTTGQILYNVQQDFIRIKSTSSPYYSENDYFDISGNLSGIARNGKVFNGIVQDTSSLKNSLSCIWLKGGTSNVELPDFIHNATTSFMNDGECLNQYNVVTNETLLIKAFDSE